MTVAGEISVSAGDYPKALRDYTEAMRLYTETADPQGIGSSYGNLGYVNLLLGNLKDAIKHNEQAIALTRQANSKLELDLLLGNLADAFFAAGDIQSATKHLEEAFAINQETGDKRVLSYLHTSRSRLLFVEARLEESRREAELAVKTCMELNDEAGAQQRRLLFARLDIAEKHPQLGVETARKALSDSNSRKDGDGQIESRTVLLEALLATTTEDSKREIASLAKLAPNTHGVDLRLAANLQIARARFALGDGADASELLTEVRSESQRLGYEIRRLEAELALAETQVQSADSPEGRRQADRITKLAEGKGLMLIAKRAKALGGN